MRIKETKMYKFDELSPERQALEIGKHRTINSEPFDYDYLKEQWSKSLEDDGFNVSAKNISWEYGGYMDGVAFSGKVDVVRFLNKHDPDESKFPRVKELFKGDKFTVEVKKDSKHCFSSSMDVVIENTLEDEEPEDDLLNVAASVIEGGKAVDKVAEVGDWIRDIARNKADEMYKELQSSVEGDESCEAVRETIIANEMEFEEE
jgi:hypothetical protein